MLRTGDRQRTLGAGQRTGHSLSAQHWPGLHCACEQCGSFFKAEDGIRDALVTGVQTCALPILLTALTNDQLFKAAPSIFATQPWSEVSARSEERRVGKECRSRAAGGRREE